MECIEPTQPQGEKSSGSGGKLELVCCIFNLPVVSMEGQVNDHLVVAQYPGSQLHCGKWIKKPLHLGGDFQRWNVFRGEAGATYLLQLNIYKVIALLIYRNQDEGDFCLSRCTEIKRLLQDKGISVLHT